MIVQNKKRPGGLFKGKPGEGLNGKWYDPFGKSIVFDHLDLDYSARFWSRSRPKGLREVMIDNIITGEKEGSIGSFVSPDGILESDREKLSAYRVLAQQMGYEVGKFSFNKRAYTALASIRKVDYLP